MKFSTILLVLILSVVQIKCIQKIAFIEFSSRSSKELQDEPRQYQTPVSTYKMPKEMLNRPAIPLREFSLTHQDSKIICVAIRERTEDGRSSLTIKESGMKTPLDEKKMTVTEICDKINSNVDDPSSRTSVKIYIKLREDCDGAQWMQLKGGIRASATPSSFMKDAKLKITSDSAVEVDLNIDPNDITQIQEKFITLQKTTARIAFLGRNHEWNEADIKNGTVITTPTSSGMLGTKKDEDTPDNTSFMQITYANHADANHFFNKISSKAEKVDIYVTTSPEGTPDEDTDWFKILSFDEFVKDVSLDFEFLRNNDRKIVLIVELNWPEWGGVVTVKVPAYYTVSLSYISVVTRQSPKDFASPTHSLDGVGPTWEQSIKGASSLNIKFGKALLPVPVPTEVSTPVDPNTPDLPVVKFKYEDATMDMFDTF